MKKVLCLLTTLVMCVCLININNNGVKADTVTTSAVFKKGTDTQYHLYQSGTTTEIGGKGTIWKVTGNKLELTNFQMSTIDDIGLKIEEGDGLILNGNNSITLTSNVSGKEPPIFLVGLYITSSTAPFEITGSGTLTVNLSGIYGMSGDTSGGIDGIYSETAPLLINSNIIVKDEATTPLAECSIDLKGISAPSVNITGGSINISINNYFSQEQGIETTNSLSISGGTTTINIQNQCDNVSSLHGITTTGTFNQSNGELNITANVKTPASVSELSCINVPPGGLLNNVTPSAVVSGGKTTLSTVSPGELMFVSGSDAVLNVPASTKYKVADKMDPGTPPTVGGRHLVGPDGGFIGSVTLGDNTPSPSPSPSPQPEDKSCEKVYGPTWHWNESKGICEDYGIVGTSTR